MISKHVSYREGVYSRTADRLGLKNDPTEEHLDNMKLLSEKIFEPLRDHVGGPIKINSFYRGPELNAAIGGSAKSQHCNGQAIDIDDTFANAIIDFVLFKAYLKDAEYAGNAQRSNQHYALFNNSLGQSTAASNVTNPNFDYAGSKAVPNVGG